MLMQCSLLSGPSLYWTMYIFRVMDHERPRCCTPGQSASVAEHRAMLLM